MFDGSWVADYVPPSKCEGDPELGSIYWFYPFTSRLHIWKVNKLGDRVAGEDLTAKQAWSFCLERRAKGPQFLTRLLMLALEDADQALVSQLSAEVSEAMIMESVELAAILLRFRLLDTKLQLHAQKVVEAFVDTLAGLGGDHEHWDCVSARAGALLATIRQLPALERHSEILLRLLKKQTQSEHSILRAVEKADLPALAHAASGESFRLRCHFDPTRRLIFEVPGHEPPWSPRLLVGVNVLEHLFAGYILTERRRLDLLAQFGIDTAREYLVYGQLADPPIDMENCISFQTRTDYSKLHPIPDPYFVESLGYHQLRSLMLPAWQERKARAVWRGSTTGFIDGKWLVTTERMLELPRVQLCRLGLEIGEFADFGITDIVQAQPDTTLALGRYCEEMSILKQFMPLTEMATYKLLVDISGNAGTWGLLSKLQLGSCILRVDTVWKHWFSDYFRPWEHYVPIREDLTDLAKHIEWCLENDNQAKDIADNGSKLARSLTFDRVMRHASERLIQYILQTSPAESHMT